MPNWPSTLPQSPINEGLRYVGQDAVIRTTMEAGPQKRRARYTATGEEVSMQLPPMPLAQTQALDTFYYVTLGQGVLPFTWKHFKRVGTPAVDYIFRGPPQYQEVGGGNWIAQLELYRMP